MPKEIKTGYYMLNGELVKYNDFKVVSSYQPSETFTMQLTEEERKKHIELNG